MPELHTFFLSTLNCNIIEYSNQFYKEKDRMAYLAGRFLLTSLLTKNALSCDLTRLKTTEYGKPYIDEPNFHFNISHAGHWVALAVSHISPVGIDIEEIKDIDYEAYYPCFSKKDQEKIRKSTSPIREFFGLWTHKESIIKADGRGLAIELTDVILQKEGGYVSDNPTCHYKSFHLSIDQGHIACLSY